MEKSTSRLKVLAILVALMFAALTTRLWFLQVLTSASAGARIDRQSARFVDTDATRGRIYDDQHRPLVLNRISLEVRVTKDQLSSTDAEGELLRLSDVLGIPVEEIRKGLDNTDYYDYQSKPVAYDVDKDISFYLSEHKDEFPGVEVVPAAVRDYPNGTMAAHVLGWVGQINSRGDQEQAVQGLRPERPRGQDGARAAVREVPARPQGPAEVPGGLEPAGRAPPRRAGRRPRGRPRPVARRRHAADRRAGPERRDREHPHDLRRVAGPARPTSRRTPARSS